MGRPRDPRQPSEARPFAGRAKLVSDLAVKAVELPGRGAVPEGRPDRSQAFQRLDPPGYPHRVPKARMTQTASIHHRLSDASSVRPSRHFGPDRPQNGALGNRLARLQRVNARAAGSLKAANSNRERSTSTA